MGCNAKGCSCSESGTNSERKINITKPNIVDKGWGYEVHIHNDDGYCGKVLHFNENAEFSMHYHVKKRETWYVAKGRLTLRMLDPDTAELWETELNVGDVIEVYRGLAHQLYAHEESDIFEVSTPDEVDDSYRVWKGDSQK